MSIRGIGLRALAGACALMFITGCGGGGGGDPTPAPQLLGRFEARLSGAQETSVTDAQARGHFLARLVDDGTLEFWVAAELDWVADVTGMHIHRGAAGSDGGIEVNLLGGGATFDAATGVASGTLSIDPALAAEIASNPAGFYVNIHTTAATGGFVRAQLAVASTLEWHASLRGDEEVSPVDPNARGAATFAVSATGGVEFVIAMATPSVTELLSGHIHIGAPGAAGNVVVNLDLPNATVDDVAGTIHGTVQADLSTIVRIMTTPGDFYVNVHTTAAPDGVARAQLATGTVEFWATLRGDEETTVVDADARGGVSLEIDSFTSGLGTFAVPPAQGVFDITAAEVRAGEAGNDGAAVIDLMAGADFNRSGPTGSADGTIALDQMLLTRMLAVPDAFHVNLFTATAATGLVRGQLTRDAQTFFTQLDGNNEPVVVDPNAEGIASMVFSAVHECNFTVTMVQPVVGDLTDAHLHDGEATATGPTLVDFLNGADVQISGDTVTGRTVVSGRTFTRLLAAAHLFYFDVHTAATPDGIARGQADRLSGDLPPAGLSYQSPVTYQTENLIANNNPTSTGGAITNYSVDPPLPAGLSLDPVTGVISGRPTTETAQADYTVTASNASGSTTAVVTITVQLSPPASLTYGSPRTYVTGTAITPLTPFSTGGKITSYALVSGLPAGLSLNTTTGVISGTPTTATAQASYGVVGSNSSGSVQANIVITITAALQPPSNLSYTSPVTYTTGTAITANTPTVSGGAVATWSISPTTLPAGLSFSTSTGAITGTPTAVTSQTTYTVTAANAAGSTTANVVITVILGAPTNLSYSPNSSIGYVTGGTFASMSPSSSGGAVSNYSISPSLPAGLSINSSTGVISGSPSATSAQTQYTVTASNSAGSTTATVLITVLP